MVTCDQQEKVASGPKVLLESFSQIQHFEGMLNQTVYEWVGINSLSMSWPAGIGPGLYKQIVVSIVPPVWFQIQK